MPDTTIAMTLGVGFLLGLRHALDADHVAAVGALVSQHRRLSVSCLLGTFWGLGHTVALLVAGGAVIAFKLTISPELERGFEMAVALLLIALGAHVMLRSLSSIALPPHGHANRPLHGKGAHQHDGMSAHRHEADGRVQLLEVGGRPFLVGLLHGLAGSAALMLLVLGAIPTALGGLLYVLVFGVGSTLGMLILSGLIGLPFVLTSTRSPRAHAIVQILAGAVSLLLGVSLAWTVH